jgi:hypothetical protein
MRVFGGHTSWFKNQFKGKAEIEGARLSVKAFYSRISLPLFMKGVEGRKCGHAALAVAFPE